MIGSNIVVMVMLRLIRELQFKADLSAFPVCTHDVTLSPFVLRPCCQVGLFRKSGVKSRIQALRQMNEASGADGGGVNYEGQSAYDVADMLKQYFRDLPEPLLTSKLSETFLQIYQCKSAHMNAQQKHKCHTFVLLVEKNKRFKTFMHILLIDLVKSISVSASPLPKIWYI